MFYDVRYIVGRNCGRLVAFTIYYLFAFFHSICSLFRTPAARSLFGSVVYLLSCFASFFVLFVTGLCVNAFNGDISKCDVSSVVGMGRHVL